MLACLPDCTRRDRTCDFPEANVSKGYQGDDLTVLSQRLLALQLSLSAAIKWKWRKEFNVQGRTCHKNIKLPFGSPIEESSLHAQLDPLVRNK